MTIWTIRGLFLVLAMSAAGCMPRSVTFNFSGDPERLDSETVIDEPGAEATVALIDIRGLIVDSTRRGLLSDSPNPVDELTARLERAEKDPSVKAVVLRINSPGGSVSGSDTMYAEIRRFREKSRKPVVGSMGEVAASGGYYVSLACDEVFAQPTTITGSIGVIIPTINASGGLARIGIVSRSVTSRSNKDIANPLEPMEEAHFQILQGIVDEFYGRFTDLVKERRSVAPNPLDSSRFDELTDGRIVTGATAVRSGLVDHEGNLRDAFARAKELAGITEACLIKYVADGEGAKSPYAATEPAAPSAGIDINLLRIDGATASAVPGLNAYYLWAAP